MLQDLLRVARVVAREKLGHGARRFFLGAAVDLDAVAGGQDHGLVEAGFSPHALERLREVGLREGQCLAHRDRRRFEVQADDDDHWDATDTAGTRVAQPNVNTTTTKPATCSHAARRPPQPQRQRATRIVM